MANFFQERNKKRIRICFSCNYVLESSVGQSCPCCKAENSFGTWESVELFQRFVEVNKPTYLNIRKQDDHLQYIVDEVLDDLKAI
ncbi:hypothetical protein D3C87_573880 [compost metagenome]